MALADAIINSLTYNKSLATDNYYKVNLNKVRDRAD